MISLPRSQGRGRVTGTGHARPISCQPTPDVPDLPHPNQPRLIHSIRTSSLPTTHLSARRPVSDSSSPPLASPRPTAHVQPSHHRPQPTCQANSPRPRLFISSLITPARIRPAASCRNDSTQTRLPVSVLITSYLNRLARPPTRLVVSPPFALRPTPDSPSSRHT